MKCNWLLSGAVSVTGGTVCVAGWAEHPPRALDGSSLLYDENQD